MDKVFLCPKCPLYSAVTCLDTQHRSVCTDIKQYCTGPIICLSMRAVLHMLLKNFGFTYSSVGQHELDDSTEVEK